MKRVLWALAAACALLPAGVHAQGLPCRLRDVNLKWLHSGGVDSMYAFHATAVTETTQSFPSSLFGLSATSATDSLPLRVTAIADANQIAATVDSSAKYKMILSEDNGVTWFSPTTPIHEVAAQALGGYNYAAIFNTRRHATTYGANLWYGTRQIAFVVQLQGGGAHRFQVQYPEYAIDTQQSRWNLPVWRDVQVPWVVNRAALAFTPGKTGTDSLYVSQASTTARNDTSAALPIGDMHWFNNSAVAADSTGGQLKITLFCQPTITPTVSGVDSAYVITQWSEDGTYWHGVITNSGANGNVELSLNSISGGNCASATVNTPKSCNYNGSSWYGARFVRVIVRKKAAAGGHAIKFGYWSIASNLAK